jgi:DNA-binding CsgD family transcriptional regulator
VSLRQADYRGILSVLDGLASAVDRSEFRARTVTVLHDLIRADLIGFGEIDPASHEELAYVSCPTVPWPDEMDDLVWKYVHQYPLCDAIGHDGDGHLRRMSDVIGRRELQQLELYQEVFHPTGNEYVMMMQIPWRAGFCRHIELARSDRDFSNREVEVFAQLQPHIISMYRRAYDHERARRTLAALEQATAFEGLGVVLLGPAGHVAEMAGQARFFVDSYFGTGASLPDELVEWVADARRETDNTRAAPMSGAYIVERADRRLIVRFLTSAEGDQLLLEERRLALPDPDPALGLTAREVEVLRLVGAGKTNREIARGLEVKPNTVRKHLENAYLKLEVGTRTAAIARAFGPGNMSGHG